MECDYSCVGHVIMEASAFPRPCLAVTSGATGKVNGDLVRCEWHWLA